MMTHREYRDDLLKKLVDFYRRITRLERLLKASPLTRKYKNQECKSARAIRKRIAAINKEIGELTVILDDIYGKLPENHASGYSLGDSRAFAAKLATKPRRRKYLKNQQLLPTARMSSLTF